MNPTDLHAKNKLAWNEAAAAYESEVEADIAMLRNGGKNLWEPELRILSDLREWCERCIHLQCAGGRDTLSLWNHGAKSVVGVDISDKMIECAKRKSEALNAPARWHCCDILETPHELDGTADLVYTGRGAIYWIMDIDAWASVIHRLLKPGGKLFVFEGHPLDWIWDASKSELVVRDSYFSDTVLADEKGWPEEYISATQLPEVQSVQYSKQWTLGQIVTVLAGQGLILERLEEHPIQYWDGLPNIPLEIADRVPHTFSLLMRKMV